jgi:hypothetical protein
MVDDADLTGVWEVSQLAVTPLHILNLPARCRVACKDSATLGWLARHKSTGSR